MRVEKKMGTFNALNLMESSHPGRVLPEIWLKGNSLYSFITEETSKDKLESREDRRGFSSIDNNEDENVSSWLE